eukprot:m.121821 g.121821  ORF g.121821 m.121821 type:complete len:464 (-) comp16210_c0_seq1:216-1607(-)
MRKKKKDLLRLVSKLQKKMKRDVLASTPFHNSSHIKQKTKQSCGCLRRCVHRKHQAKQQSATQTSLQRAFPNRRLQKPSLTLRIHTQTQRQLTTTRTTTTTQNHNQPDNHIQTHIHRSDGPDLDGRVPADGAEGHAVLGDLDAGDALDVRVERGEAVAGEGVPHADDVVVVAGKEDAAAVGEADAGDAGLDVVVLEAGDGLVGAQIKEADLAAVVAGGHRMAAREEAHAVDVGLQPREALHVLAGPHVPDAHRLVHGGGGKDVVGGRADVQGEGVGLVAQEGADRHLLLDVPEDGRGVARGGEDLVVIKELAGGEEALVAVKLLLRLRLNQLLRDLPDGAAVVEAARGNEGARGRIGTGHDPHRAQLEGLHLVVGKGVPDNELAVLGRADEMLRIRAPGRVVDLAGMRLPLAHEPQLDRGVLHLLLLGHLLQRRVADGPPLLLDLRQHGGVLLFHIVERHGCV